MKIAIPIWDGRISPVMDTAACLLITARGDREAELSYTVPLPTAGIFHRARVIAGLKIDLLICGAISRPFEDLLLRSGIKIFPWVSGKVDEVLAAYWEGNLAERGFNLPGCRFRKRGSGGFGRRRRRKRFNSG